VNSAMAHEVLHGCVYPEIRRLRKASIVTLVGALMFGRGETPTHRFDQIDTWTRVLG
jgi:hypothetical protein